MLVRVDRYCLLSSYFPNRNAPKTRSSGSSSKSPNHCFLISAESLAAWHQVWLLQNPPTWFKEVAIRCIFWTDIATAQISSHSGSRLSIRAWRFMPMSIATLTLCGQVSLTLGNLDVNFCSSPSPKLSACSLYHSSKKSKYFSMFSGPLIME